MTGGDASTVITMNASNFKMTGGDLNDIGDKLVGHELYRNLSWSCRQPVGRATAAKFVKKRNMLPAIPCTLTGLDIHAGDGGFKDHFPVNYTLDVGGKLPAFDGCDVTEQV